MKKADIVQRSANDNCWTHGVPAINVKWYPYLPDIERKFRGTGTHEMDSPEFWAWFDRLDQDAAGGYPHGEFCIAEEIARETGWEDAKDLAAEMFSGIHVYSSGRSGGWLVVHGLEDVESWDAIAVTRWAKFQRGVLEILDDMDYRFLWNLAVNVFEARQESAYEFYRRLSA